MTYSQRKEGASVEERFWMKVDKNGPVIRPELGSCWIWTARRNLHRGGYGLFHEVPERPIYAHRFAWKLSEGSLPDKIAGKEEKCVLHRCDNPACVRRSHLFLGTRRDNAIDSISKGRRTGERKRGSNYKRKLSDDQVREIRLAASVGATPEFQAGLYAVHPKTIKAIVALQVRTRVT